MHIVPTRTEEMDRLAKVQADSVVPIPPTDCSITHFPPQHHTPLFCSSTAPDPERPGVKKPYLQGVVDSQLFT